jgi:hypothetical protein
LYTPHTLFIEHAVTRYSQGHVYLLYFLNASSKSVVKPFGKPVPTLTYTYKKNEDFNQSLRESRNNYHLRLLASPFGFNKSLRESHYNYHLKSTRFSFWLSATFQ